MVMCLVLVVILTGQVKSAYLFTEEWVQSNFAYKVVYLFFVVQTKIVSCYAGFSSMEANFIACGQSYKPAHEVKDKDGKVVKVVPEDFFAIK